MKTRPIINDFLRTPWVAATPVDDSTVRDLVPQQVQVAFEGGGPLSTRRLVPLTPAAHELLYGRDRDHASRVIRGMLATIDGREGVSNLRGMSLSTTPAGFATNMLMSNIESGWLSNTVRAGDRSGFERDFTKVAPDALEAKAQNTGWVDLGPRASSKVLDVIRYGAAAGRDAAEEAALTMAHELQHSITPPNPKGIDGRLAWLEEGAAETLAWWPGTASSIMGRMGVPVRDGHDPDPFTAAQGSTASDAYRRYHTGVLSLLGLAGIEMYDADGRANPAGRAIADRLLQADSIDRVPRDLARAIGRRHGLSSADEGALADLIVDSGGDRAAIAAISDLVTRRPSTSAT